MVLCYLCSEMVEPNAKVNGLLYPPIWNTTMTNIDTTGTGINKAAVVLVVGSFKLTREYVEIKIQLINSRLPHFYILLACIIVCGFEDFNKSGTKAKFQKLSNSLLCQSTQLREHF